MLGYRTRAPLVAAGDDRHVLPGGGMLRPVVLIDGLAAGTWGLGGPRRTVTIDWFRHPAEPPEVPAGGPAEVLTVLDAERLSVETFLGS